MVNLLVFRQHLWSLYVIGACVLIWVMSIPAEIYTKLPIYLSLLFDGLAVMLYQFLISFNTTEHSWFFGLSLPLTALCTLATILLAFCLRKISSAFLMKALFFFAEAALLCAGIELLIRRYLLLPLRLTWSAVVCSVCGVMYPLANVKGDDIKVDSKDNKTAAGDGLVIKADDTITGEVLADIKAAVSDGAITVTVTDTLQLTNEQKAADGGKSALTEAAKTAGDEVKKELNKLAEKLDALRGDKSRKNAQLEKVVDVTVALVKTEGNEIKTVAQLIELPHSVTVTIPITDELYAALQGKRVCVVRSHTDSSGNVTTAELSATLGGTKGNYVLTFQTDKASAFAIVSYETVSSGYYYGGSGTADSGKKDSAKTADDSQMTIWLGSAVMTAAAVVVLTYKKKRASK